MPRILLSLFLLAVPSFLGAIPVFDGNDFVTGSGAVDAARYLESFLDQSDLNDTPPEDQEEEALPFLFGLDALARWVPARFRVYPLDANDLPLVGPNAGGEVDGALLSYRAATRFLFGEPEGFRWGFYLTIDYFVASHLDDIFQLFDPWYSSNDVISFMTYLFTLGLYGPLSGGRATGFAAVAGQVLPGIEVRYQNWLNLRLGYLFKFRDPIAEDGRFISQFFVPDNGWTGVTGKSFGDYLRESDIPEGVSGIQSGELYLTGSIFGVDLDSLLDGTGALQFLALSPNLLGLLDFGPDDHFFSTLVRGFRPFVGFIGEGFSRFSEEESYFGSLSGEFLLDGVRFLRYQVDGDFTPIFRGETPILNQALVELIFWGMIGGVSWEQPLGQDPVFGYRLGTFFEYENSGFELGASYNYLGSNVGNLNLKDEWIWTIAFYF